MNLEFSPKQAKAIAYDAALQPFLTIHEGAVRSGKTFVDNFLFTNHVRNFKGKDFIVTGYTIGSIERNVLRSMEDMFKVKITTDKYNSFEYYGNRAWCFGADSYDAYKAMQGLTAFGWYGNEVALQHPNTIAEAFNRCSGKDARIFWDTNPDYPDHPIKKLYIDKHGDRLASGRLRILSLHWEIDDNPALTEDYKENLKKSTPKGPWYDRKIRGLWTGAEGVIYEDWNVDRHTCEPFDIPEDWPRFRAIDFGFQHPFVCLWGAQDYDGRLYIYREYVQSKKLISVHARAVRELSAGEQYYWTVSDHDAQERAEYEALDVSTHPADKNVHMGIQHVAERLVLQGDGRPRLQVFRTCPETIRTMSRYQWAPQKPGIARKEEPLKFDDDPPDCVRYMVQEMDGGVDASPQLIQQLTGMKVW